MVDCHGLLLNTQANGT